MADPNTRNAHESGEIPGVWGTAELRCKFAARGGPDQPQFALSLKRRCSPIRTGEGGFKLRTCVAALRGGEVALAGSAHTIDWGGGGGVVKGRDGEGGGATMELLLMMAMQLP